MPPDRPTIITIDGPAGTGKSSVARELAARIGLDFLDTGAMYRAAAAIVIDHGIDRADADAIVARVAEADLHFDWRADPPTILAWNSPIARRIRDADVTAIVSPIASIGKLREHMVRKQRIIANQHPRLVSEGRDQGSVVFPDADAKFYLDADPKVRARRRAEQLRAEGRPADEPALLREIVERDRSDSTREDGPLVCPDDAIVIDTSHLSREEVVQRLEDEVRVRIRL
ncbi:MAG TPA: (d)CMP kinase [Phycisphaerales bacterium]|nr:(d)CMP kinase [Phycisphaerales bacterium]